MRFPKKASEKHIQIDLKVEAAKMNCKFYQFKKTPVHNWTFKCQIKWQEMLSLSI